MTEKDKTKEAAPEEKKPALGVDDVIKTLKEATGDKKKELKDLLGGLLDKPATPEKAEEKKPHEHEEKKHAEHGEHDEVVHAEKTHAHGHAHAHEHAAEKAGDNPAALTGRGKIATLAGVATVGTAASLAAANVALPLAWQTSVGANVTYQALQATAAPIISTLGLPLGLPVTVLAGILGLGVLGKVANGVVRIFKPDHGDTGWGKKNIWYGAKVVTLPVWGTWEAAKWVAGQIPGAANATLNRGAHEARQAVKWTAMGGLGVTAASVLIAGALPTVGAAVVGGALLGYGGNLLYRAWNRFILQKPSTLQTSAGGAHGHGGGHDSHGHDDHGGDHH